MEGEAGAGRFFGVGYVPVLFLHCNFVLIWICVGLLLGLASSGVDSESGRGMRWSYGSVVGLRGIVHLTCKAQNESSTVIGGSLIGRIGTPTNLHMARMPKNAKAIQPRIDHLYHISTLCCAVGIVLGEQQQQQ